MPLAPRRDPQVQELLEGLDHPLKSAAILLREAILDASPEIVEGYKWKSPSFRTKDFFATINLADRKQLRMILHTGAKARGLDLKAALGSHPGLVWLGAERAMMVFAGEAEVQAGRERLGELLREWMAFL